MHPPPQTQEQAIMPHPNPNASTPRPTQLPTQPTPNPNNKPQQQWVYSVVPNLYPTYALSLGDIHLHLGNTLPTPSTLIITELCKEEEKDPNLVEAPTQPEQLKDPELAHVCNPKPPFPQRLEIVKQNKETTFDIMEQLKHICVKIPLFQVIEDIPIYGQSIKEVFLKNPGRKVKDPTTVHVVGQLVDIMLGRVIVPKYAYPGSPIVEVIINGMEIKNALIDLGTIINVMTKEILQKLNFVNPRPIATIM